MPPWRSFASPPCSGAPRKEYATDAGPTVGGLVNATLGNAVELIIALIAVSAGLVQVVKASLSGSIIANLLLVLGAAMFAGGLRHKTKKLHARATATSLSMVTLSVIAIGLPALFFFYSSLSPAFFEPGTPILDPAEEEARVNALWLFVSAIMIAVYVLGLAYALITHKHLFHEPAPQEVAAWSKRRALVVIFLATRGVALMAETLVGSIEGPTATLGLSELFVGVVIVAIVGNAAEHSSAILVAMKNKMDLAFQITLGSSSQIALFVAPVLVFVFVFVFVSFAIARPMDLVFEIFELFAIAVGVAVTYAVTLDEESNGFEGAMILGVYAIICAVFYFHP